MSDNWPPPIVMELVTDPVEIAAANAQRGQAERNWDWLEAHASEVYSHRGKHICIAGQELFVGDTVEDVLARARAAHADDKGLVTHYVPKREVAVSDNWPPVVMEVVTDPVEIAEFNARHEQFKRNCDWLDAHASEAYSHRGKHICIAGQELFVGDSVEDVLARARAAHPDDKGLFTHYVPKEKGPRIYAHRRLMEGV